MNAVADRTRISASSDVLGTASTRALGTALIRALGTALIRALGTTVSITGVGADAALAELERLETVLTRFSESPLTRLNRDGALEHPPVELLEALKHALWVADWTGGLVTPTVLSALEQAGYRGSWEFIPRRPGSRNSNPKLEPSGILKLEKPLSNDAAMTDWRGIEVTDDRIRLPDGVRIDLGGTGKTWIAERISWMLEGDFVLDAGGDIVARQSAPFTVQIQHPFNGEPLMLELPAGRWGVATSSTVSRAWDGGHHLIDPRHGRPLESRFVQVTVVADRATIAEVVTKLAFLDLSAFERFSDLTRMVLCFEQDGSGQVWNGTNWNALEEQS
jgi:FAD:protein FMN transferase